MMENIIQTKKELLYGIIRSIDDSYDSSGNIEKDLRNISRKITSFQLAYESFVSTTPIVLIFTINNDVIEIPLEVETYFPLVEKITGFQTIEDRFIEFCKLL